MKLGFDLLSDITAVDYWQKQEPRFEVVYQLVSRVQQRSRLRVRVASAGKMTRWWIR